MKRLKRILQKLRRYYRGKSIQFSISISFTLVAVGSMVVIGVLLYTQFTESMRKTILQENQQLVNQIALNVNYYVRNMKGISDSMYYNVIKNADLTENGLRGEMSLLYEANINQLVSIACYKEDGTLVGAAPNANQKGDVDVRSQPWFTNAIQVIENSHFTTPHVQNLFEDSSQRYNWVISLSRMVELTSGGATSRGVLLVDMNYSGIEQIFTQMTSENAGYVYLIDKTGEIVYHPKQKLIYSGLYNENNQMAKNYTDGIHQEVFEGAQRQVIVKTTGYTGWRVVSIIPNSEFAVGFNQMRLFAIGLVGFAILLIIVMNSFVSSLIANPIKKLERSVKKLDDGTLDLDIFIGGPYEIEKLGKTIRSTVEQLREVMDEVVREQELKRKSEFDALQAQINPHFLYNTLDSIVWMVESGQHNEAISMVTALASLFRISLSKGQNFIPIKTELQHAGYYLYIQNIRYKNKFTVTIDVEKEIEDYITIKLILQPLLENAIYHAMEVMDGEGEITITGFLQGEDVWLAVEDNGLGMPPEKVDSLLTGKPQPGRKGSGIGLRNVHQRIQLYYGAQYGLEIESELDIGTTVKIHLPKTTTLPEEDPKEASREKL